SAEPTRLDAFERIVRIHTELRDFHGLRDAYVRMITRTPADADANLRHALQHQLGLVYRDRLGDAARALDAFRAAVKVKPESEPDRKCVLELLIVMDQLDIAVNEARSAIAKDPERAERYQDLYELFLRCHAHDRAWCAASVLAHMGRADQQQTDFLA